MSSTSASLQGDVFLLSLPLSVSSSLARSFLFLILSQSPYFCLRCYLCHPIAPGFLLPHSISICPLLSASLSSLSSDAVRQCCQVKTRQINLWPSAGGGDRLACNCYQCSVCVGAGSAFVCLFSIWAVGWQSDPAQAAIKFKGWNAFWVVMVHYGCKWVFGVNTKEDGVKKNPLLLFSANCSLLVCPEHQYTDKFNTQTHKCTDRHTHIQMKFTFLTLNGNWFVQQRVLGDLYRSLSHWVCVHGCPCVQNICVRMWASAGVCVCLFAVRQRLWLPAVLCPSDWKAESREAISDCVAKWWQVLGSIRRSLQ